MHFTPVLLLVFLPWFIHAQNITNEAFQSGEQLKYRVYYSSALLNATAGEAVFSVEEYENPYRSQKDSITAYHVTATGTSKGLFDFFYKVRDKYESFFDKNSLLPYVFVRNTNEGGYEVHDFVVFDHEKMEAKTSRKTIKIPDNTYDILSAIYFMRTMDISDFGPDSLYLINFYLDDSVYYSAVKFLGHDTLKMGNGFIPTIKIAPMMATGEVFAEKYPMFVWVTDDKNHIPVLASSKVIVGSVKMELTGYSHLKNPFIAVIQKRKR